LIRKLRRARLTGPLLFACVACEAPAPPPEPTPSEARSVRVIDDAGETLNLEEPPQRILSLVPSATGILLALGQRDRLVGRTDYDLAPEVADLPSVGGGLGASVERIVALNPDLVIHFRADSDPGTPRQLEAAGIPHLAIRPDRIEDIRRILRLIGTVVHEAARADSLVASLDSGLADVSERVAGTPRPRVVLIGGDPPTVAGSGTFLHELLGIAGGDNVFADVGELYAPVSLEEILRREADLILVPESVRVPPVLESIPVRRIPLDVLTPGLEVTTSARVLASILHPELSR
jgi:iron complex transport system substrate-binding protein